MEAVNMTFQKVERSYYIAQNGWRLATFEEARLGLNMIKEKNILNKWDRVRLLDGWITGVGYNFEMGNDFKGCLGYMLLVQTRTSDFAYADVNLSDRGKEVALFLCVDDWNFEVVYWLLNSWSRSGMMNLDDVRGGNIPLINAAKFKEMNKSIGHVARRLGDEAGAAREEARKTEYSGVDSVEHVLSGMLKCVTEEEEIVQFIGRRIWFFQYFEAEEYCLPDSVKPEEVADVFWSFVCDSFAGHVVEMCAFDSFQHICNMKKKSTSGTNLMVATCMLLYLSDFRTNIIHEPMAHNCTGSCAAKILSYAAKDGDPKVFNEMLKKNGMWRCYEETGNYSVLHKLLTVGARAKKYRGIDEKEKVAGDVVKMLLECGAEPERRYAIGKSRSKTTLYLVAKFRDEDVGVQVAEALLWGCAKESIDNFVNAKDDRERTALHRASEKGNARICKLLLDWDASLNIQDVNKMTALHYAVEGWKDKVTDVLLESSLVTESLALKDYRDRTALDISVADQDYQSTTKLLSKTREPEAYLSKLVDKQQLLRYSILVGSVEIASLLLGKGVRLPAGDCDDDGRTAFHLVAMCSDESSATAIISFIIYGNKVEHDEEMLVIKDKRGRTALHEAAVKGHEKLCRVLLQLNSELIYVKDRNGQNPLFHAVRGNSNGTVLFKQLRAAYLLKDRPEHDLVDRSGLTPLHVAASEGKAAHVKELLSGDKFKKKYLSRGDMVGQTALHKAATRGHINIVEILLRNGAHPLRERDCDGRNALHYAVQADIEDKTKLVETLLKKCTEAEKSLLVWASAAGFGTAEQNLDNDDPLKKFLLQKKKTFKDNLLRMAASIGDIEMMKELLGRGYQMGDIRDGKWKEKLTKKEQKNVDRVANQIEAMKERGNDKPAISDSLGRLDYAHGLAGLFLNPYIKPPIAVGITGSWGMGKSSVMMQTQRILLATAAHMALLQSSKSSSSASELPGIQICRLSKSGTRKCEHICRQIDQGKHFHGNILKILWNSLKSTLIKPTDSGVQEKLEDFLKSNDPKDLKMLKAVAAMDSRDMFEKNLSTSKAEEKNVTAVLSVPYNSFSPKNWFPSQLEENAAVSKAEEETVPAVLTVQYNAWKYKNDTEALAGLAVEITSELEGIMTPAQWLNTCWRYNWEKKKFAILFEIFIPCFLAMVLAGSIAWIAWIVLGSDKFKKWGDAKYAWPPAAAVTILWTLTRKVMGVLKPISCQLMQYASAPDHTNKLGYQERVISDIKFLKAEIGENPHRVFIVIAWICCIFSLLLRHRSVGKAMETLKITPAPGSHLRIIVFLDDLDRCDESVILQVLSAVNLVLAVCEISAVLGMDKKLIERAILKKHGDQITGTSLIDNQNLAEMYLQKIIQLPLDLPDPSDEETIRFLRGQLGVLQQNEDKESMEDDTISSIDEGEGEDNTAAQEEGKDNTAGQGEIDGQLSLEIRETERTDRPEVGREVRSQTDGVASVQQNSSPVVQNPFILQREILFVPYSEGEENAFLYFQGLATECRKLPREWKRLLNYHRLVWYIFSVSKEANKLYGWQVQFIAWIFVCWEWQENMDLVIKKWKEIVKTSESKGLSLLMIVEHLMEEHQRQNPENAEDGRTGTKKSSEGERSAARLNNGEETISSSTEAEELNGNGESWKKATSKKLDELEKSLAELKEEMKELKKLVSSEMKNDIKELQKHLSDQIKEDIKELQRQVSNEIKQKGKNEENMESKKIKLHNLENWERMKSALERYDVPMDSIQAFQRFRFYCIAGYLPLPS